MVHPGERSKVSSREQGGGDQCNEVCAETNRMGGEKSIWACTLSTQLQSGRHTPPHTLPVPLSSPIAVRTCHPAGILNDRVQRSAPHSVARHRQGRTRSTRKP